MARTACREEAQSARLCERRRNARLSRNYGFGSSSCLRGNALSQPTIRWIIRMFFDGLNAPGFIEQRTPVRRDRAIRASTVVLAALLVLSSTGCSSLFSEGAATTAAIGGTALAGKVTSNAAVAAGIGLGVLAAAQAGVKYVERNYHDLQQDRIAAVAGQLPIGKVAAWESKNTIELEPDARGKVTVNRVISFGAMDCKEIVFSVEEVREEKLHSSFFVATICRDADKWKWATAEPATARWGSLQ